MRKVWIVVVLFSLGALLFNVSGKKIQIDELNQETPLNDLKAIIGAEEPEFRSIEEICREKGIAMPLEDVHLLIEKSQRKLTLYSGDNKIKTYNIALGFNPIADKEKEGDGATPEGDFLIVQKAKNPEKEYFGTRWMRLNYPNAEDAKRGLEQGLITQYQYDAIVKAAEQGTIPPQNTPLGGGIGIHGGSHSRENAPDWTAGCIGLYDDDVEEIYDYVVVGTKVRIEP
jgi:murein L,D-transpeptidase YafK